MNGPRSRSAAASALHAHVVPQEQEIIVPYDKTVVSLTAVRNVLLQSSLAELKALGHYHRYASLIAPSALDRLLSSLGPGWIPVELALAHYQACDDLLLSDAELEEMGRRVGVRIQETVLISLAKNVKPTNFDLWLATGVLHRMWARVFQGGTTQISKRGPKSMLVESQGYLLHRFRYYRSAHVAVLRAIYEVLGARLSAVKVVRYSPQRDELVVQVTWE
jgi:hypothetical protein